MKTVRIKLGAVPLSLKTWPMGLQTQIILFPLLCDMQSEKVEMPLLSGRRTVLATATNPGSSRASGLLSTDGLQNQALLGHPS